MKKLFSGMLAILILAALVLSGCTSTSTSGSASDFYKGKTVTILVPNTPAAVVTRWCRLAAPYFEKITGAQVMVQNEPAAAGLPARNRIYGADKPDGLTLMFTPSGGLWQTWALDEPGTEYDITKFNYLGGILGTGFAVSVVAGGAYDKADTAASIKAMQDAKGFKFGASGAAELPTMAIMVSIVALELDATITAGYKGSAGRLLALTQKEIDGMCNPVDSAMRKQDSGQSKLLFLVAQERDKVFPDVPALGEFVKFSDRVKKLMKAMIPDPNNPEGSNSQLVLAPPGTPKDRVEFLRKTWMTVFEDKNFQDEVIEMSKFFTGTVSGEELQKNAAAMAKSKGEFLSLYKDLMKQVIK
ncbi:tripartite tricarboxylate transporter substrate-binding protein [Chloroflexota bacterium]